jgi:pyridoxine 4-dehydrogenase
VDLTGGKLRLASELELTRMGFGAMRLAGPGVWGPPANRPEAMAVLQAVVDLGLTHIDTSDYYGPHTVNQLIREALSPYPENLHIVTKLGGKRGPDKSWLPALRRDELIRGAHDNLKHLDLLALDLVNLRMDSPSDPDAIIEPFSVLAELRNEGLIKHLGVSGVSLAQLEAACAIAPVVCVQNLYNLAARNDDELVDICASRGIAFVPFFPLGGFGPLQSDALREVASDLGATPMQTALAWLLHRSPTMLLIPGTSSLAHLRENVAATRLELPSEALARLNAIWSRRHLSSARGDKWQDERSCC